MDDDGRYMNTCGRGQGKISRNTSGGWSSDPGSVGSEGVYTDQVIAGLLGDMSEERKLYVKKVWLV